MQSKGSFQTKAVSQGLSEALYALNRQALHQHIGRVVRGRDIDRTNPAQSLPLDEACSHDLATFPAFLCDIEVPDNVHVHRPCDEDADFAAKLLDCVRRFADELSPLAACVVFGLSKPVLMKLMSINRDTASSMHIRLRQAGAWQGMADNRVANLASNLVARLASLAGHHQFDGEIGPSYFRTEHVIRQLAKHGARPAAIVSALGNYPDAAETVKRVLVNHQPERHTGTERSRGSRAAMERAHPAHADLLKHVSAMARQFPGGAAARALQAYETYRFIATALGGAKFGVEVAILAQTTAYARSYSHGDSSAIKRDQATVHSLARARHWAPVAYSIAL